MVRFPWKFGDSTTTDAVVVEETDEAVWNMGDGSARTARIVAEDP